MQQNNDGDMEILHLVIIHTNWNGYVFVGLGLGGGWGGQKLFKSKTGGKSGQQTYYFK